MDGRNLLFLAVLVGLSAFIALRLNTRVREPYMDEVFHVRQAQEYCAGNYGAWDDKITTFPGLYLMSSIIPYLLRAEGDYCTVGSMRFVNLALAHLLFVGCLLCRNRIRSSGNADDDSYLQSILVVVYPVSVLYYFLYYTDTASLCLLVWTYCLALAPKQLTYPPAPSFRQDSAAIRFLGQLLVSSAAIAMRQTNAVWVLFVVGTSMLARLEMTLKEPFSSMEMRTFQRFLLALLGNLPRLIAENAGFLASVAWFAAFVVVNGGIVVGDKEHHKPVLHFAMPLHMVGISVAVAAPSIVVDLLECYPHRASAWPVLSLPPRMGTVLRHCLCGAATTMAMLYGSLDHPFLLADNRHYSFYLWRRVLQHPQNRLMLGPVYYLCCLLFCWRLRKAGRGPVWIFIYFVAACLTLVPAHLLEPRYFTPGVVLFLLNGPPASSPLKRFALFVSTLLCLLLSVLSIYVFVERPFVWSDGSVARFLY